jgi:hypothetical protein
VAQPSEDSKTETLNDPELNPLLNPLLASNMGRWAEVYFTSPPEKRAEAVTELLRELERNPPPTVPSVKTNDEVANLREHYQVEREYGDRSYAEDESASEGTCPSCGHRSSSPQKFCGMCGMPLAHVAEENAEPPSHDLQHGGWREEAQVPTPHFDDRSYENRMHDRAREFEPAQRQPYAEFPSLAPARETPTSFSALSDYEEQSMSRSKGIYIGIAILLILVAIGIVRWRTGGGFPNRNPSSTLSSVSHPIESPPESNPQPSQPAPSGENATASSANPTTEPAPRPERKAVTPPETARPTPRPSPSTPAPASNEPAAAIQASGAEDLATAQKYLNPAPGAQRDTGQAALWLWKAVSKQNVPATMLLADLYLRGDGVTKSCDQAHVLLDAAARKGNAAAGERLRHLQAFGCQ